MEKRRIRKTTKVPMEKHKIHRMMEAQMEKGKIRMTKKVVR